MCVDADTCISGWLPAALPSRHEVFKYIGNLKLESALSEVETAFFTVLAEPQAVFYSWTSNWGTEEENVARISLPDPLDVSVAAEYSRHPNGTNAVDYPEVLLMKVLAKTLFQKAGKVSGGSKVGDSEGHLRLM